MPDSPLIFRFCNSIIIFQHSNVFFFNVINKICHFFKKRVFPFLGKGTFQRGVKFSKILRGLLKKEGSDRFRIFWEGLGNKGWGQGEADSLEDTMYLTNFSFVGSTHGIHCSDISLSDPKSWILSHVSKAFYSKIF